MWGCLVVFDLSLLNSFLNSFEPERVHQVDRIAPGIRIQVPTARKPAGVLIEEPAQHRRVKPGLHAEEAGSFGHDAVLAVEISNLALISILFRK